MPRLPRSTSSYCCEKKTTTTTTKHCWSPWWCTSSSSRRRNRSNCCSRLSSLGFWSVGLLVVQQYIAGIHPATTVILLTETLAGSIGIEPNLHNNFQGLLVEKKENQTTTFNFDNFHVDESPPFVIFYNIFIPKENPDNALRIVREQMDQIRHSYVTSIPNKPVTIYYNTIETPINATWMNDNNMCHTGNSNMVCKHMNHYDQGFEEVTVQKLYEFCHIDDIGDDMRVIYIHNKGSFHERRHNEIWRSHLTMAAVSELCVNPPPATTTTTTHDNGTSSFSCDVCALQFWPLSSPFFPGNFWASKCSYIRKLVPPVQIESNVDAMAHNAMANKGQFTMNLFNLHLDYNGLMGLGRFALENWVGMHPSLHPCDVSTNLGLMYWSNRRRNVPNEFSLRRAPRASIHDKTWGYRTNLYNESFDLETRSTNSDDNDDAKKREYFLLPGLLYKWQYLYNETPPADSWVWSWYPAIIVD